MLVKNTSWWLCCCDMYEALEESQSIRCWAKFILISYKFRTEITLRYTSGRIWNLILKGNQRHNESSTTNLKHNGGLKLVILIGLVLPLTFKIIADIASSQLWGDCWKSITKTCLSNWIRMDEGWKLKICWDVFFQMRTALRACQTSRFRLYRKLKSHSSSIAKLKSLFAILGNFKSATILRFY